MSDIAQSDPKKTVGYRVALGGVITLGVLIVAGIGLLIIGITKGWGSHKPAAPAAPTQPISMTIAQGYSILSSDTQPGRLILHLRSPTEDEIDIIDMNDGHIISQIHAQAPK